MTRVSWVLGLMLLASTGVVLAQSDYERARELAFSGQREAAREVCREILRDNPDHADARILLGRTYAWDGQYVDARRELELALQQRPYYTDARNALVDVEMWSDNHEQALELLNAGLARDPTHPEFLYKKAQVLRDLDRDEEAERTVDHLLALHPAHGEALDLYSTLRLGRAKQSIELKYAYTDVSDLDDPWQDFSLAYKRRTGIGTVIGRLNVADRFNRTGFQVEADAYPRIADGMYAYLNYGYSPDSIFPEHRYGAEIFFSLPRSFEFSIGARHLDFENSNVTIYTGTIARYFGNWWVALRPFVTPDDIGDSRSYTLFVRRYLDNVESFIEFTIGTGSGPEEFETIDDLVDLDSEKIGLRMEKTIGDFYILELKLAYRQEELTPTRDREEIEFGIGLERRF